MHTLIAQGTANEPFFAEQLRPEFLELCIDEIGLLGVERDRTRY
ncbi:hypothetical protein ACFYE9_31775 [Rhizobium leguminosarum]|nr:MULTISPECIES: hypothetical protein [Rhizobium]